MFWPISASSFEAWPDVSSRLAAGWIWTLERVDFPAAFTPSFIAAKNGLSRPLIITPTDLPALLDALLLLLLLLPLLLSLPPQAATLKQSAAPAASAIPVLRVLPIDATSLLRMNGTAGLLRTVGTLMFKVK